MINAYRNISAIAKMSMQWPYFFSKFTIDANGKVWTQ